MTAKTDEGAELEVTVRNPFRQGTMRQAFEEAVLMYRTKHKNFFVDGKPYRGNSWASMFWRGFEGVTIGQWDRASRAMPAYATWCAGRAVAKAIDARKSPEGSAADALIGLSPTALRALRELAREPMPTCLHPMGGNKRGPILSACRSMVRKGLMQGDGGSRYGLTDVGLPVAMEALRRWRAERDVQRSTEAKP